MSSVPLRNPASRAQLSWRPGDPETSKLADASWLRRRSYEGVTSVIVACPNCAHEWAAHRGHGFPIVDDGLLMLRCPSCGVKAPHDWAEG